MPSPLPPHCQRLLAVGRAVLERLPDADIRAAFVFGSTTWGDADAASDIDLMLLLDRPEDFRAVTRVRVAEVLGSGLGGAPRFADIDRVSAARFAALSGRGAWAQRIVNSVILRDADGFFAGLRARATKAYRDPMAMAARFAERRQVADGHRTGVWQALQSGDAPLAALHARLAVEDAGRGLVEAHGGRVSTTHFVDSVERSLSELGEEELLPEFGWALGLGGPPEALLPVPGAFAGRVAVDRVPGGVARALEAYVSLAEGLRAWMAEPQVAAGMSGEDRAWAEFTYGEETYDEIAHKVEAFLGLGRVGPLQYYLDGLLLVPARLNLSKVFALRATGTAKALSAVEFHAALAGEAALFRAWVEGLRLEDRGGAGLQPWRADAVVGRLLGMGEVVLERAARGDGRASGDG